MGVDPRGGHLRSSVSPVPHSLPLVRHPRPIQGLSLLPHSRRTDTWPGVILPLRELARGTLVTRAQHHPPYRGAPSPPWDNQPHLSHTHSCRAAWPAARTPLRGFHSPSAQAEALPLGSHQVFGGHRCDVPVSGPHLPAQPSSRSWSPRREAELSGGLRGDLPGMRALPSSFGHVCPGPPTGRSTVGPV